MRMMRLAAAAAGLVLVTVAQAQMPDTSASAFREYLSRKLVVDVGAKAHGSYGGGVVDAESWTKWTPHRGFSVITEPEFYETAGYPDLAEGCRQYICKYDRLRKIGVWMMLPGLAAVLGSLALLDTDNMTPFYCVMGTGLALTFGGMYPGLAGADKLNRNYKPAGTARSIASEYNARLRQHYGVKDDAEDR